MESVNHHRASIRAFVRWARADGRIVLRPADEKARRGVEQPCPVALAADFRTWLKGKAPGLPVLPLHHETARMTRRDLEAVGLPYETEEGIFDFHALRGAFISRVERSGASVKTLQTLARHAKVETTLACYARASMTDVVGAVESLLSLGCSVPRAGLAAVEPAHHLTTGGDVQGRLQSESGGMTTKGPPMASPLAESQPPDGEELSRSVSASDGISAERGGDSSGGA